MILILNICKEEMHYHEFVRPIEDILRKAEMPFVTRHYLDVKKSDLDSCHRIIISGTSLKDMSYSKDIVKFNFLKKCEKPVLGICGGMQILCVINGCRLIDGCEIGLLEADFNAEFLGAKGSREVYMLHNMAIKDDAMMHAAFSIYARSRGEGYIQAIKHRHMKQYGVLFHPEVRNKDMILKFLEV